MRSVDEKLDDVLEGMGRLTAEVSGIAGKQTLMGVELMSEVRILRVLSEQHEKRLDALETKDEDTGSYMLTQQEKRADAAKGQSRWLVNLGVGAVGSLVMMVLSGVVSYIVAVRGH